MSRYVLVHGAWHQGSCFNRVAELLREEGHQVDVFDLPGHGSDQTPLAGLTITDYAKRTLEVIGDGNEPVILVGHSMGGAVITAAAAVRPDRIRRLVYLTAFYPDLSVAGEALSSGLETLMEFSADGSMMTIQKDASTDVFYNLCSAEDAKVAAAILGWESLAVLAPQANDLAGISGVEKVFIECLEDHALPLSFQRAMQKAMGARRIFTLPSDHSPFLSMPERLVDILVAA